MAAQRPGGMAQIASQAITSLPYALPVKRHWLPS